MSNFENISNLIVKKADQIAFDQIFKAADLIQKGNFGKELLKAFSHFGQADSWEDIIKMTSVQLLNILKKIEEWFSAGADEEDKIFDDYKSTMPENVFLALDLDGFENKAPFFFNAILMLIGQSLSPVQIVVKTFGEDADSEAIFRNRFQDDEKHQELKAMAILYFVYYIARGPVVLDDEGRESFRITDDGHDQLKVLISPKRMDKLAQFAMAKFYRACQQMTYKITVTKVGTFEVPVFLSLPYAYEMTMKSILEGAETEEFYKNLILKGDAIIKKTEAKEVYKQLLLRAAYMGVIARFYDSWTIKAKQETEFITACLQFRRIIEKQKLKFWNQNWR